MTTKTFHLRIYDNGNYMEESEAYNHGQYASYEAAEVAAKAIVDEFLKHNWKKGMAADDLSAQYSLYGEDPVILPNEPGEAEKFSAWNYARLSAEKICRKPENK